MAMAVGSQKRTTMKGRGRRTRRLNIRATEKQERLIRLGAERRGLNVSSFVIASACSEAEQSIADQNHFTLPEAKWARFLAVLDRPARARRELVKLMSEPSILER